MLVVWFKVFRVCLVYVGLVMVLVVLGGLGELVACAFVCCVLLVYLFAVTFDLLGTVG